MARVKRGPYFYFWCGMGLVTFLCWLSFGKVSVGGQAMQGDRGRMPMPASHHRQDRTAGTTLDGAAPRKTSRKLLLARVEAILTDRERDVLTRKAELVALLAELPLEEFPAVGEVVRNSQGLELLMEVAFVGRWAELDPEAALAFSLPDQTGGEALAAWADRDLEAAVEWMIRHRQAAGVDRVFDRLARMDRKRAFELANAYPEADWQYKACMGMSRFVLEQVGVTAFRDWVSEIQNPRVRCTIMEKVGSWSPLQRDPAGMLAWLEAEPPETSDALRGRFLQWVGKDHPALATEYFDQLPAERRTREAFASVIEGVGGFDPRAAVDLMERHPAFADEGCTRELIRSAMLDEPDVVLAWIGSHRDEGVRRSLRQEALGFWHANRSDIARSWIEIHGTAEDRQFLQTR